MAGNSMLVVGIDFGTTYSGGAFSFKHDFDKDPTKISAPKFQGGKLYSLKGPTCALIRPDGKTLDKFGYEAEDKYVELASDGDHESWYFFRRFKMRLWDQGFDDDDDDEDDGEEEEYDYEKDSSDDDDNDDDADDESVDGNSEDEEEDEHDEISRGRSVASGTKINRNTLLEDESGRNLPAHVVFSLSIRYLKDQMLKMCHSQIGDVVDVDDIHWVLTVPAIWDNAAKQFMREAAVEAGIDGSHLTIALEPEAASLLCRHLPMEKGQGTSLAQLSAGKRYLVLDAGGGTVDITVHEVACDGSLIELDKPSGGAWGGTQVDEAFLEFLTELIGSSVMISFKKDSMEDYLGLLRDFELKKRNIGTATDSKVTIPIPVSLTTLLLEEEGTTFDNVVNQSEYSQEVAVKAGKLRIEASIMRTFFQSSIENIVEHVGELLDDPINDGVEAILMVGGYSESPILQENIRANFSNLKIIVPNDAGLAVLKGAVIFGHTPSAIKERISKHTYGIAIDEPFEKGTHPSSKRFKRNGTFWCENVFSKHIEIGQSLKIDEVQSEKSYTIPTTLTAGDELGIRIFATEQRNPKYTTDVGCSNIGQLSVPVSGSGSGREVIVKMMFGGTEIGVECIEVNTGKVSQLKVDFLS